MFNKYKVRKYVSSIQNIFTQDNFTDLFLETDILGYSDSVFDKETYFKLSKIFNDVYTVINSNLDFSELLLDGSDYLIPYTLGWIKLHVMQEEIKGITFYYKHKAYKLYLNNINKTVNLNVLDIKEPRSISIIQENLNLTY